MRRLREASVRLRPLPLAEAKDLGAGRGRPTDVDWHPQYPLPETLDAVRLLFAAYEALDLPLVASPVWWLSQIVADEQVVGDAGFHGPAVDGCVEIGYAVVPDRRRQGIGGHACALLVDYAWSAGADRVVAEIEGGNLASQRVVRGRGFLAADAGRYALDRRAS